jgi:hypothetical protein
MIDEMLFSSHHAKSIPGVGRSNNLRLYRGNSDKRIKNANPNLQIETETPASSLEQLLLLLSLKSQ